MSCCVELCHDQSCTLVRVDGELTTASAAGFSGYMASIRDHALPVVFDLRGLDCLDATGIKMLELLARQSQYGMVVINTKPHIKTLLRESLGDKVVFESRNISCCG